MNSRFRWVAICGGVLIALLFALSILSRRGPVLRQPPSPNAYAELVELAKGAAPAEKTLAELNRLLGMPSAVVLPMNEAGDAIHMNQLSALKELNKLFQPEVMKTLSAKATNRAVELIVDQYRLAGAAGRGGLLIDGLVATAIESSATRELMERMPELDSRTRHELGGKLGEVSKTLESPETVIQTEQAWRRERFGLVQRWGAFWSRKALQSAEDKFREKASAARKATERIIETLNAP